MSEKFKMNQACHSPFTKRHTRAENQERIAKGRDHKRIGKGRQKDSRKIKFDDLSFWHSLLTVFHPFAILGGKDSSHSQENFEKIQKHCPLAISIAFQNHPNKPV